MGASTSHARGRVEWFDDKLGSGLIKSSDGHLIYVHYKDLAQGGHRTLRRGDEINFDLYGTEAGTRVKNIQYSGEFSPRIFAKWWISRKFIDLCLRRGNVRYMWTLRNGILHVNMVRYYLIKSRYFEVYFHQFIDDDESVLHDHPWSFLTIILSGGYDEELSDGTMRHLGPGRVVFRDAAHRHRVLIADRLTGRVWTVVATGRRKATWSFFDRKLLSSLSPYEYAQMRGAEMRIDADFAIKGLFFPKLCAGTRPPQVVSGKAVKNAS